MRRDEKVARAKRKQTLRRKAGKKAHHALRENEYRATARAIQHAQSDERARKQYEKEHRAARKSHPTGTEKKVST